MLSSLCCRNTINYIKLQHVNKLLTKNIRQRDSICSKSFHFSFKYSSAVKNVRENKQQVTGDKFFVNTNIKNNVLLYDLKQSNYFRIFKVLCCGWLFITSISAYSSYDPQFILRWTKGISWAKYVEEGGMDLILFMLALIAGCSAFLLYYLLMKRYIKYIVLHKGGTNVSIITHHLFKDAEITTVPIESVTALYGRNKMTDFLPLKIEGKSFYYLVDARGKFCNEQLFDYTLCTRK